MLQRFVFISFLFCLLGGMQAHAGGVGWSTVPAVYSTGTPMNASYDLTPSDIYYEENLTGYSVFETSSGTGYSLADEYAESASRNVIRRQRPDSWKDPDATLGEVPVLLVVALVAMAIFKQRKKEKDKKKDTE